MNVGTGLMTLPDAQLAVVCRRITSPLMPLDDSWWGQPWWHRLEPEPVDIFEYAGERVIDHSRHHWHVPLRSTVKMSAEMMVVGVLSLLMDLLPMSLWGLQAMMWCCAIGHSGWMSRHLLRWRADIIIVTNWRMIRTGGILSSRAQSYRWDTVGNCFRNSSALGRIFGFCELRIIQSGGPHNVGADAEYCPDVPIRIARLIESRAVQPSYVYER
jgi:hypothetical protein